MDTLTPFTWRHFQAEMILLSELYMAGQAAHSLLTHATSVMSAVGVSLVVMSVCILPPLAYGKSVSLLNRVVLLCGAMAF